MSSIEYDISDAQAQFESISFDTIVAQSKGNQSSDTRDEIFATLNITLQHRPGSHTLKVKVDTGAQGNILPLRTFRRMFPQSLDVEGYQGLVPQRHRARSSLHTMARTFDNMVALPFHVAMVTKDGWMPSFS